jgi:6-phosphogluconate dehydrogenase
MHIGMIGLGKMGANMTTRLVRGGHNIHAFDLNESAIRAVEAEGAQGVSDITALITQLETPRVLWVMLPAGDPTENTVNLLFDKLSAGDIVIDGGNSNYKETMRRAEKLATKGIHYIDVGTSGGVWGITEGYGMMVGGDKSAVDHIRPILQTLAPAPDRGWGHVGPSGAGHFVKMVHNGIEYGIMQAYAEGFEILKSKTEFQLDVHNIAEMWRFGTVIRSWLLDLIANALADDPNLSNIRGWVADSGEGRWTVFEAIDLDIPAPVITASLMARFISRQEESYAAKLLAALRNQFGGHAIKRQE